MTGRIRRARIGPLSLLTGCALVLAGGCTDLPRLAPAVPAAGTQFDGTYVGRNSLVKGWGFQCGAPIYPETVVVRSGRFDYVFAVSPPRTTPIAVQIASDGTFSAQMQYGTEEPGPRLRYTTAWVTVTGRIAGSTIDATAIDLRCVRRLTATLAAS
jgi:hypothetical protein